MDSRKFARLVYKTLEQHFDIDNVTYKKLGNRVHVFIEDQEFVIVVHSTEPERRLPFKHE